MKLVMTLLVRDEEDIISANIEYHLARGVDFFVVTDNLSEDHTPEILEHYRGMGVLHRITETDDSFAQHEWVTRMARMAHAEFGADWVIESDADEFWWPEKASDLKAALQAVPVEAAAVRAERHNFVPRPRTANGFVNTMIVREARSVNALGAPLPPKVCHRGFEDVAVEQGNHAVSRAGVRLETVSAAISILHFPLRTYRQFAHKIAVGGAAYERSPELKAFGGTWRMLHEKLKRGELEEYYRSQELDDEAIERGLVEGRLEHDDRLRTFVQQHGIGAALSR